MQKRATTAAHPLSLSSSSLSNTAQSICEAFALYIRQIPLLFWPFLHFFILQVQVASRRVVSRRLVCLPCAGRLQCL